MKLSFKDRVKISDLSNKLWGSKNRWQKMMKHPRFQMLSGYIDVEHNSDNTYQRLEKNGPLYKNSTLVEMKKANPVEKKTETVSKTRNPDFDEMYQMMELEFDISLLSYLKSKEPVEYVFVAAYRFSVNGWNYQLFLRDCKGVEEQAVKSAFVRDLPEPMQLLIDKALITDERKAGFPVLEFLEVLKDSLEDPVEAKRCYKQIMSETEKKVCGPQTSANITESK